MRNRNPSEVLEHKPSDTFELSVKQQPCINSDSQNSLIKYLLNIGQQARNDKE